MKYSDLRDFISKLKQSGELTEVSLPVSPYLEMTELCDRTLRTGGPALLFTQPQGHQIPVLGNLFGTPKRVAMGMRASDVGELRRIGQLLAMLKEPEPPKGFRDVLGLGSLVKAVWDMAPRELRSGAHRPGARRRGRARYGSDGPLPGGGEKCSAVGRSEFDNEMMLTARGGLGRGPHDPGGAAEINNHAGLAGREEPEPIAGDEASQPVRKRRGRPAARSSRFPRWRLHLRAVS